MASWWQNFLCRILQPEKQWSLVGSWRSLPIVVSMSSRNGGCIHSIKWGSVEFIDAHDRGRMCQTAWQIGNTGEQNNPTEAGSTEDDACSSTQIVSATLSGARRETITHPAYWYKYNGKLTSPHTLRKIVELRGNVLSFDVSVTMASPASVIIVESLTAYLQSVFTKWEVSGVGPKAASQNIVQESGPIIVSRPDGIAIGIAHREDGKGMQYRGGVIAGFLPKIDAGWYVKSNPQPGVPITSRVYIVVGTVDDVREKINELVGVVSKSKDSQNV